MASCPIGVLEFVGPSDDLTPFDEPFYVSLNYAIGGSRPEDPDPGLSPQRMLVDWARYWAGP